MHIKILTLFLLPQNNNKMKTQNNQAVITLLESNIENVDFAAFLSDKDFTNFDEVCEILEDNGAFNVEIIYYRDAMRYLIQHDTSLRASLSLASDMGYTLKDLNSETLASLLASENVRNEFYQLESEINSILVNIEQEANY